jgi:Holliday junction resolvase RusA-like endonuclease
MNEFSVLRFWVPGVAAPGGSKTAFRTPQGRTIVKDACKRNPAWRASVAHEARTAYRENPPLTGPLSLDVVFHVLRPKGHYGTGRRAGRVKDNAPQYPIGRPDATKLVRALEDALTGIIWKDDAQIVRQRVEKRYDELAGADVSVTRLY